MRVRAPRSLLGPLDPSENLLCSLTLPLEHLRKVKSVNFSSRVGVWGEGTELCRLPERPL